MSSRFNLRFTNIPAEIWLLVSQIDTLKGQWMSGAQLPHQLLGRLKRSVLVTSSGASTRIEGSQLSDEDVEKLMRGIRLTRFADRDTQEVQGYYELLETLFNVWKSIRFSESTVKHCHKELLKYTEKDAWHRGDYKKNTNRVEMTDASGHVLAVLFETTPPYLTPKEMQELTQWTQDALATHKIHPLFVIGHFIVEFLKIHPFQDGNGRLSRVLSNLLLLQSGYVYMPYVSLEKLIEDNKADYYVTLRKSQQTLGTQQEDIVPWLAFFLRILHSQATMAVALLNQEPLERLLSPRQFVIWEYLQTVEIATTGEIANVTGIPRPTVNQALEKLLRLKKIERLGFGRGSRYRKVIL